MKRRTSIAAATGLAGVAAAAVLLLLLLPDAEPAAVSHGPRDRPWVALTFDADMTPGMLARLRRGSVRSWFDETVVEELRAQEAPSTIFLTGLWAQTYPSVVRSLAGDPLFELENHSMSHAAFRSPCFGLPVVGSEDEKQREVLGAAAAIASAAGVRPRYFRFPGGCHGDSDLELVRGLGQQPVQWDVVSGDSFLKQPDAIVRKVLDEVRPGSIIVFHLNGAPNAPATAHALRALIPELRRRGLRPVTLRSLLAPGS